jgi:LacI family transcriptional regulator
MANRPQTIPTEATRRIAIAIELDQCVPWHQNCCEGILRYGQTKGWSCVIDPFLLGPVGQKSVHGYDGVVGRIETDIAQVARDEGIPVVNHWNNSPAQDLPSVFTDLQTDGKMAGEHLATCGYKQLAYLGVLGDTTSQRRIEGLCDAAARSGLAPPMVRLIDTEGYFSNQRDWHARFRQETAQWIADLNAPVGLFVGESTIARYVAQFAPQWGLELPTELGLVVWTDDVSTNAISPTLTVIEHDWFDIGYQAAALLDELMQGNEAHPLHRLVPPTRLIARDSTDVFICDDELVRKAMRYIAEHCREELHVEDIVDALNTSRRTLYRKFDEVLGRSVKDEIKRLRINRLKLMLEETDLPLVQLAESFGFSSQGQFSRYFSAAVGMTPSAYRKKFALLQEA